MADHPAALQLRLLQTVVEVAAEKNSTLVMPFPVELLRFLERATPAAPAPPSPELAALAPADPRDHERARARPRRTAGVLEPQGADREPGQVHRFAGAGLARAGCGS